MVVLSCLKSDLSIVYYCAETQKELPVLLYCHTFSGNKIEGLSLLHQVSGKYLLCLFDFRGCGNTSDEFVTLGLRETIDLRYALDVIHKILNPKEVYLWGRSMGAATIIHFISDNEEQKAQLNDSNFKNKSKISKKAISEKTESKNKIVRISKGKLEELPKPKKGSLNENEKNAEFSTKISLNQDSEKQNTELIQDQNRLNEDLGLDVDSIVKKFVVTVEPHNQNNKHPISVASIEPKEQVEKIQEIQKTKAPHLEGESKNSADINQDFSKPIFDRIKGVVLDSPFTDSHRLITDIMTKNMRVAEFVAKLALLFVKSTIKSNVKYDVLGKNKPIKKVKRLKIPCLFLIGEKDEMIDLDEFKKMFDLCESDTKGLRYMQEVGHPDFRPNNEIEFAISFLNSHCAKIEKKDEMEKINI